MAHAPVTEQEQSLYEFVSTAMSTTVSVQIVGAHSNAPSLAAEAFDWFRLVEAACSRFDPSSELSRLYRAAPEWVAVSPLLFEVLRVAIAVAHASDGAFDPTVGAALAAMGFDTEWQTGRTVSASPSAIRAEWRDVELDEATVRVRLRRPLLLDLGAVAKGFALDLAARAMAGVADCCLVAGGDLLCRGRNARGRPWRTAITDPLAPAGTVATVEVDAPEYAVCTSGGYRRRTANGHHLLVPQALAHGHTADRPVSATGMAGITVVAPQAVIADALSTAAFVMGMERAVPLLAAQGVDALLIAPDGTRVSVAGWGRSRFTLV